MQSASRVDATIDTKKTACRTGLWAADVGSIPAVLQTAAACDKADFSNT